ncbi:MAG: T9SS type B sorting domain-containing protein [Flavobacteriales bacterium]|nr:T9SS type B sorting domain-containing protein [Flavobacteriales bacterium]
MNAYRILLISILLLGYQFAGAQCNAGDDVTVTLCDNGTPIDLFTTITGAPISGGSWLDPNDGPFTNPFDPTVSPGGIYKYIVSVDLLGNTCATEDTAFVAVTIVTVPIVTFSMDDNEGCGVLQVQFDNTTGAPGFINCDWEFGDGGTSSVCSPMHIFSGPGCYDVSLTVSNTTGCSSMASIASVACVLEAPVASFELEQNPILTSDPIAVFIDRSIGAATHEYIIPGVGNFSEPDPQVEFLPIEGTYFTCLEVTAVNGCEDSYCSNVLVRDDVLIYVPSAFTPNLDNVNETFKPTLSFDPQRYELRIFDRWGNEIFYSDSPEIGWSGSSDQSEFYSPDGYYAYRIKAVLDGEVVEKVGQVTLLR